MTYLAILASRVAPPFMTFLDALDELWHGGGFEQIARGSQHDGIEHVLLVVRLGEYDDPGFRGFFGKQFF